MKEESKLTEEERLIVDSTIKSEDDLASLRDDEIDEGKVYAGDGVYL